MPHLLETAEDSSKTAKVVRIERSGLVEVDRTIKDAIEFSDYLSTLRDEWKIPTLTPQYVVGEDADGSANLYIVVDKLNNAKTFNDALERQDKSFLDQYERLGGRLCMILTETMEGGGPVYPEVFRLDQYVVADENANLPVLVDVEPTEGSMLVGGGKDRTPDDCVEDSIRWLVEDVIYLQDAKSEGEGGLPLNSALYEMADTGYRVGFLDDSSYERVVQAIKTQDPSLVSVSDDWWYER